MDGARTHRASTRTPELPRLSGHTLWLTRVVWATFAALGLALFAISLPATPIARGAPDPAVQTGLTQLGMSSTFYVAFYLASTLFVALVVFGIGAVIAWRKFDDPMAFLVSTFLILWGTTNGGTEHVLDTVHPELHLLTMLALGVQFALLTIILFVFPDGRFVPRWSRLPVLIWCGVVLVALLLSPPTPDPDAGVLGIFGFLFGGLAQIYRYARRSTAIQRQQTKWVSFALIAQVLTNILALTVESIPSLHTPGVTALLTDLGNVAILTIASGLIPVALAIAILRYRLWDIDIIVRRTLVYALLTGALAAVYVGGVILFERISQIVLGQESDLAIVGSTLAIAALFQPLRRRIQAFIDRRFYRRNYDAARTLATFGQTIRDEVDLGQLSSRLVEVAAETMRPAQVGLWLRPASGGTGVPHDERGTSR